MLPGLSCRSHGWGSSRQLATLNKQEPAEDCVSATSNEIFLCNIISTTLLQLSTINQSGFRGAGSIEHTRDDTITLLLALREISHIFCFDIIFHRK